MSILTTVLVTFFAGMGAGLGTGFAGMSVSPQSLPTVRSPRLSTAPRVWCSWCWALP